MAAPNGNKAKFLAQQIEFSAFLPVSTKLILLVIFSIYNTKLVDPWVRQKHDQPFFKTLVVMDVVKHDITKHHKMMSKSKWLMQMQGKFDFNSCVETHRCARKRIYHESEVLILKSVPRVKVWHHLAEPCDAKL